MPQTDLAAALQGDHREADGEACTGHQLTPGQGAGIPVARQTVPAAVVEHPLAGRRPQQLDKLGGIA